MFICCLGLSVSNFNVHIFICCIYLFTFLFVFSSFSFSVLLLAVAVALGTQNALAPNLSRIAETFHFSEAERDIRVGGELA